MRQILVIAASVLLTGITNGCVFQDRSGCPAYLSLDFSGTQDEVSDIHLVIRQEDGHIYRDTLHKDEFRNVYELPVRRGKVDLAAFGNIDRMAFDDGFLIEQGNDADNLFTFFLSATYDQDLSFDTVTLRKDFTGLHIRIAGEQHDSLEISIECNSVGYGLDGKIIEGRFIHYPESSFIDDGNMHYYDFFSRITRQMDTSLTLTVSSCSGARATVAVIPLSGYLSEAGIDMESAGISDLFLTFDISRSSLVISTESWTSTEHINITI
ncbi:MAG TPA: FimB/Mfa2 family fimbrial subunit [Candidatus Coprenecus stercoravium]|uniref:FimB/Mfa2 family fimbrial subunit n=1 Tax=Candidatus Coprenecus stercoravium TaxID=2840735 RepID=A0A9D2GS93_9BACT|nr:FimB/Mfa2 family fimbrial subunit [Candidatus Coprenecus stercoravium]